MCWSQKYNCVLHASIKFDIVGISIERKGKGLFMSLQYTGEKGTNRIETLTEWKKFSQLFSCVTCSPWMWVIFRFFLTALRSMLPHDRQTSIWKKKVLFKFSSMPFKLLQLSMIIFYASVLSAGIEWYARMIWCGCGKPNKDARKTSGLILTYSYLRTLQRPFENYGYYYTLMFPCQLKISHSDLDIWKRNLMMTGTSGNYFLY